MWTILGLLASYVIARVAGRWIGGGYGDTDRYWSFDWEDDNGCGRE